jgi:hypothetical protein
MSGKASHRLTSSLGAIALTLVFFGCHPTPPAQGVNTRPECPTDYILLPGDSSLAQVTSIAGSGPISLVPEYHDCQRMLNPQKTEYGSLIAVFARNGLDTMPDPPPPPTNPNHRDYYAAEQAAATILNYDGPYQPLRIESGINCLYVYAFNGNWMAHIIRVGSDSSCLKPLSSFTGGFDLKVSVTQGKDVPAVARWDWDKENREQYIGMRCGTDWCEVSNPSHSTLVASEKYSGSPMVEAKGWYDEQVLAVNGSAGGPSLVPGGVVGTIFPIGQLEKNTKDSFDKLWKPVALVSLSAASPKYLDKFNFVVGPPPLGNSEVSLCMGTRDGCQIPSTAEIPQCENQADPWWARIVSGGTPKYRCVIRREHPGIDIPGATRWRWQVDDDDMWVRCPTGCCHVT